MVPDPVNNLWVLIAALLVFTMTIAVGFLEVGELGEDRWRSLLKTTIMTCLALVVGGLIGFNIGFAPPVGNGLVGNPLYSAPFFGGFDPHQVQGLTQGVWWSMGPGYFDTGLTVGTYFLFETAFAAVTLALVGVVAVKKIKLRAFTLYCFPYFAIIWALPAAWIWNPTGWLAEMGMADLAGGLVVHGAAGAAGLGLCLQIWREERARGLKESPQITTKVEPTWLTLSILLLWVGWFGFNPGSVLAFNSETTVVVLTTFLAAATAFMSLMFCRWVQTRRDPGYLYSANGILMGLIIITPVAGFVGPTSAVVLGVVGGPLFLLGERVFGRLKWLSDPIGLYPGHLVGGLFGVAMIAFFTQGAYAAASGYPNLPNGLFFAGGMAAVHQLGVEMLGVVVVMAAVFLLSFLSILLIAKALGGATRHYFPETPGTPEESEQEGP